MVHFSIFNTNNDVVYHLHNMIEVSKRCLSSGTAAGGRKCVPLSALKMMTVIIMVISQFQINFICSIRCASAK